MLNHQRATQLVEFPLLSKFWSSWHMWSMKLPQGQGFCCNICQGNVRCGLAAPTAYVGVVLGASPQYMVHDSGYIWTKNHLPCGGRIHWAVSPSKQALTIKSTGPRIHQQKSCGCVMGHGTNLIYCKRIEPIESVPYWIESVSYWIESVPY